MLPFSHPETFYRPSCNRLACRCLHTSTRDSGLPAAAAVSLPAVLLSARKHGRKRLRGVPGVGAGAFRGQQVRQGFTRRFSAFDAGDFESSSGQVEMLQESCSGQTIQEQRPSLTTQCISTTYCIAVGAMFQTLISGHITCFASDRRRYFRRLAPPAQISTAAAGCLDCGALLPTIFACCRCVSCLHSGWVSVRKTFQDHFCGTYAFYPETTYVELPSILAAFSSHFNIKRPVYYMCLKSMNDHQAAAGCLLVGSLAAGAAGLLTVRLAMSAVGLAVLWGGCQAPHWGAPQIGAGVMDG